MFYIQKVSPGERENLSVYMAVLRRYIFSNDARVVFTTKSSSFRTEKTLRNFHLASLP